jgi:hypothetical protein
MKVTKFMGDGFLLTVRPAENTLFTHIEMIAMKFKVLVIVIGLAIGCQTVFAQGLENAPATKSTTSSQTNLKGAANPFSLLSTSRIRWSNSYSVSFFSGGGRSGSVGLLNTSMMYEFSPKLSLGLNLGILHNPSSLWGDRNNSSSLLPGMRLDFHPSNAFRMVLDIRSVSGALNPYDRSAGFWYDPVFPYDWSMQERK